MLGYLGLPRAGRPHHHEAVSHHRRLVQLNHFEYERWKHYDISAYDDYLNTSYGLFKAKGEERNPHEHPFPRGIARVVYETINT